MEAAAQIQLSPQQLEAFYTDKVADTQATNFAGMVPPGDVLVVDIGGGCGHFAERVRKITGRPVLVLDTDPASVAEAVRRGVPAEIGDAVNPTIRGDERVAAFNLILHHLVADTEAKTRQLQVRALAAWRDTCDYIFVNEYVYTGSVVPDFAGRFIYEVTSSRLLSHIGRMVSRLPGLGSLRANTFGVGVRFRSDDSWRRVFADAGYSVVSFTAGKPEHMPLPRKLLGIKQKRQDFYLLRPTIQP